METVIRRSIIMTIKPSSALREDYTQISMLAKASGEPIFITDEGEADMVLLSVEAYEERERMLSERAAILEAEFARLSGVKTYSIDEARKMLREKIENE
jgi:PHD/YefM family antitoxin component YafN of YafNO toxin-antitoxin module